MVIISKTQLNEFGKNHADSADALNEWYETVKQADWGKMADLKQTFNSVDYVGNDRYVFNIKGNNYRLVAMIFFNYLGRLRNGISSLCLPLTLKGAKAENAWPSFRTEAKPGIFSRIAK